VLKEDFKIARNIIFLLILLFTIFQKSYAQDCTVNADIDKTLCENQPLTLLGSVNGNVNSVLWQQIAGPSVIINNPTTPVSGVQGIVGSNTYTFKLTAACGDGNLSNPDFVTFTVNPISKANAGSDLEGCPSTYSLAGNAPSNSGDSGAWSILGANNAGVTINTPNSQNSTITLPPNSFGTTTLVWTISNANGCSSSDTMTVTNYGGETIANAGPDQTLSECFTSTQSTSLSGSIGGNGTGSQIGTWSFVSGPSVPNIVSANSSNTGVTNLIEGTYVFRWSVQGPCAMGTDTVSITVPAATQDITSASISNASQRFCLNSITSTTLTGNTPNYQGETVQWVQTGGPTATIVSPTSPTTQITGLNGSSTYNFSYTITGNPAINPGCSSTASASIAYYNTPTTVNLGSDIVLPVDVINVTIPVSYSGGNRSRYKIISGPSTTTSYVNFSGGTLNLNLTQQGTYTIRVIRDTSGSILTGCNVASDDVNITVSLTPTVANAGTDAVLACNVFSTTLSGNTPTQGIGRWSQISGPNTAVISDLSIVNPIVSSLTNGVYTFRWSITGGPAGTDAFDDMNVTVASNPSPNAGPDDSPICYSSYQLQGNIPEAGVSSMWTVSPSAGVSFSDATDPKAIASGLSPNTAYTFTLTQSNSCGSFSDDVIITTNSVQGPSPANAGPDQCLPSGTSSVTLGATIPTIGAGSWSFVSGPNGPTITNPNSENSTVTGLINGTYEFQWTNSETGCISNSDTVFVTIAATPTSNAGIDQYICGSSITMAANTPSSGLTGSWVQVSGNGSWSVDNIASPTATFSNLAIGNYEFQWVVSKGNCTSASDNMKFTVNYPPTVANAGPDATVCDATSVNLAANNITQGVGTWTVLSGAPNNPTITNVNNPNTSVTNLVTGTYTFRWTATTGSNCSPSFDDVVIQVSAPANAGPDQGLCNANNVFLQGTEGSTGTWSLISSSGGFTPVITPSSGNSANVSIIPGNNYTFRYTKDAIYGCGTGFDEMNVVDDALPVTPNAGPDQNLCTSGGNVSTNLAATGTPGTWTQLSGPNTATVTDVTNPTTPISNLIQGLYIFEWNTGSGNCANFKDVVRINVYDPPSTANAGPDQNPACQLSPQLNAIPPTNGIGTWSITTDPSGGGITIDSPNNPNTTLTVANPYTLALGSYTFTWTVSNGPVCAVSIDSVDLVFTGPPPDSPYAGSDQNLCNVTTAQMSANPINLGIGMWSQLSGPTTGVFSNKFDNGASVNNLIAGTYEFVWSSSNGGCNLSDIVKVTITSLTANANAGPDQTLGEYDPIVMAAANPSPLTGEWSFVFGPSVPVIIDKNNPNSQIAGTIPGTYEFTWTVTNGSCAVSRDNVQITLVAQADLSLIKSVDNSLPKVGDILTFTIAVTNSGGHDGTGISVKDDLPVGYTIVTGSVDNGGVYNIGGRNIKWAGLSIAKGATLNLTYKVTVNAPTGTLNEYKNTSQVISEDQIDPDSTPNNNVASEDDQSSVTTIPQSADLSLAKIVDNSTPNVGDNVVFTITANNVGPDNASLVKIKDVLPAGYTYLSDDGSGSYDSSTGIWTLPSALVVGVDQQLKLTAKINASAGVADEYKNSSEIVESDQFDPDSTPNNDISTEDDQASATTTPKEIADLSLTKGVDNPTPTVGDNVTFTVNVTNAGPSDATGIIVKDMLPSGYSFVSYSSTSGIYNSSTGNWTIPGAMANVTSQTLQITAKVLATGNYTINLAVI